MAQGSESSTTRSSSKASRVWLEDTNGSVPTEWWVFISLMSPSQEAVVAEEMVRDFVGQRLEGKRGSPNICITWLHKAEYSSTNYGNDADIMESLVGATS